jgi:ADP-ribose pyrophosphatase YjhB (NUDIX family)
MTRIYRYQGAILRDHHILLVRHQEHESGRDYWLVPGGGREPGESEEQCVIREMQEETNLTVRVERLLFKEHWQDDPGPYRGAKTYLCTPISGEAKPGHEPEPEAAAWYAIAEVRWVDLREEASWGEKITNDPFTYPFLKKVQAALAYE